jgi:nitrite transporter NirC
MYRETVDHFAHYAVAKRDAAGTTPLRFFVASMMAGAYVGLAIILIYSLGADAAPAYRHLIMGASFGVGLTLVVFAGGELFTGQTMYMTHGLLGGCTGVTDLLRVWTTCWLGNLAGSVLVAMLFAAGGGGGLLFGHESFLFDVAATKMNAGAGALLARGVLCNWLVCLALWMAARTTSDAAKCIVIFWCLFVFIGSGYEHSVANMTLLTLALLGDHPDTVTLAGFAHNLLWVTLGNAISGVLFMGVGYWYVASPERNASPGHPALAPATPRTASRDRFDCSPLIVHNGLADNGLVHDGEQETMRRHASGLVVQGANPPPIANQTFPAGGVAILTAEEAAHDTNAS